MSNETIESGGAVQPPASLVNVTHLVYALHAWSILAGIVGASLAPYLATWLAANHGVAAVGIYLCIAATVSALALVVLARRPVPA